MSAANRNHVAGARADQRSCQTRSDVRFRAPLPADLAPGDDEPAPFLCNHRDRDCRFGERRHFGIFEGPCDDLPRDPLSGVSSRQRLEHQDHWSPRRSEKRAVGRCDRRGRSVDLSPPRLRPWRRPVDAVRHPDHDRHPTTALRRHHLRLRERERPRSLPLRRKHRDRGRQEHDRRSPHVDARSEDLHLVQALRCVLPVRRQIDRRISRDLAPSVEPPAASRMDVGGRGGAPDTSGLVTYTEVRSGHIDHAIRFTAPETDDRYIWPARHEASDVNNPDLPPMGARFRLKASFDLPPSLCSRMCQTIVTAMKEYGLILADNGSSWYFQGASDPRWTYAFVDQLKQIPASAFVAVDESSLMCSPDSGRARQAGLPNGGCKTR